MAEIKSTTNNTNLKYLNVMADGKYHQTVEEGTQGAVLREGETRTGEAYSKWELIHDEVIGKITSVVFQMGKFGEMIYVGMDENTDEGVIISLTLNSKYAKSFMEKLPNLDVAKTVVLKPYNFTDKETGKQVSGITVGQGGTKVESYYWDKDAGKQCNGIPEFPKNFKELSKAKQALHWEETDEFLKAGVLKIFPAKASVEEVVVPVMPSYDGAAEEKDLTF